MDTTLALTLSISILINILSLRWAYREHIARRRYQQETQILRQTLRGNHPNNQGPAAGLDRMLGWLMLLILLVGLLWWTLQ